MSPSETAGFRFGQTIFSDVGIVNYLLDTSAVSALMRSEARMEDWLSSVGPDDNVSTSVITRGEVLFGIERLAAGRRRTELEDKANRLLTVIPCEAIPVAAGDRYASLKREQQRRGLPLDENDLWIAATALALGTTLVSDDSDFQLIQELHLVRP
jgi:predicted nucleic acid-binding protein